MNENDAKNKDRNEIHSLRLNKTIVTPLSDRLRQEEFCPREQPLPLPDRLSQGGVIVRWKMEQRQLAFKRKQQC